MYQDFEFKLAPAEIDHLVGSVMRFERMRIYGGIVLIAIIGLAGIRLADGIPAIVAVVGMMVIWALGSGWLRAVRRAGRSAAVFVEPSTVVLTGESIAVANSLRTETVKWDHIMHGSETESGWLFVAEKTNSAFVIPRRAATAAQTAELGAFLSTWPKRRMRRVPARRAQR